MLRKNGSADQAGVIRDGWCSAYPCLVSPTLAALAAWFRDGRGEKILKGGGGKSTGNGPGVRAPPPQASPDANKSWNGSGWKQCGVNLSAPSP
jgi:hypothetical protein